MSWQHWWPWGSSRNKHPSLLINEELARAFDGTRDIGTYEFVVFDTELTGLDRRRDEIVSIAAIRIKDMRISLDDSFHSLVRTKKRDFGEGTFVHGSLPSNCDFAPRPEEVLPAFVDFCRDSVSGRTSPGVGLFLSSIKHLGKSLGGVLRNPCLDSMELARAYWKLARKKREKDLPKIRSFNLTELSVACHLPLFKSHDALGDALQTACLFLYLAACLRNLGFTTFKDFSPGRTNQMRGCRA